VAIVLKMSARFSPSELNAMMQAIEISAPFDKLRMIGKWRPSLHDGPEAIYATLLS